ncbi:MAG: leucyl aminopeptidase [Proteobacteria bacterium]|nr:leucyl aminopeptidase [Pseudomonadota bacterium]
MSQSIKIQFVADNEAFSPVLVLFAGKDGTLAEAAAKRVGKAVAARIKAVATTESFSGKAGSSLALPAESGLGDSPVHLLLVGTGEGETDFLRLGGQVQSKLPKGRDASVFCALPGGAFDAVAAAEFSLGFRMAAYRFDRYQTKKGEETDSKPGALSLLVDNPAAARKEAKTREAIYGGIELARDLVNEPPNVLTPAEFAKRAAGLEKLGVEIEVLDEKALKKLGMRALLGVGQGSEQESHVVVMKWLGAKDEKAAPVALVGKGVVFDTGGISIKPAESMEDMKGDMAGAAAVVGAMHALAARKAKANVVGVIGLVENMPDGKAQRPGDIVTSMSGQTIEIINTDAEGRLVLADVLWYTKTKFNPKVMVNCATLTGAIIVALGVEHAGLFSNNDELAANLTKAGLATGEKVWRMPLAPEYDKIMDSKFADVKNSGGRKGGSIIAAQFLQRFVDGCPWAHIDLAGTAMGSPVTDISKGWASGYGVRLFDRLVADHYEG